MRTGGGNPSQADHKQNNYAAFGHGAKSSNPIEARRG